MWMIRLFGAGTTACRSCLAATDIDENSPRRAAREKPAKGRGALAGGQAVAHGGDLNYLAGLEAGGGGSKARIIAPEAYSKS